MGVRIIEGKEGGSEETVAVLFDSVTGWAFGPLFGDLAEAEAFLEWLKLHILLDSRDLGDHGLARAVCDFRKEVSSG